MPSKTVPEGFWLKKVAAMLQTRTAKTAVGTAIIINNYLDTIGIKKQDRKNYLKSKEGKAIKNGIGQALHRLLHEEKLLGVIKKKGKYYYYPTDAKQIELYLLSKVASGQSNYTGGKPIIPYNQSGPEKSTGLYGTSNTISPTPIDQPIIHPTQTAFEYRIQKAKFVLDKSSSLGIEHWPKAKHHQMTNWKEWYVPIMTKNFKIQLIERPQQYVIKVKKWRTQAGKWSKYIQTRNIGLCVWMITMEMTKYVQQLQVQNGVFCGVPVLDTDKGGIEIERKDSVTQKWKKMGLKPQEMRDFIYNTDLWFSHDHSIWKEGEVVVNDPVLAQYIAMPGPIAEMARVEASEAVSQSKKAVKEVRSLKKIALKLAHELVESGELAGASVIMSKQTQEKVDQLQNDLSELKAMFTGKEPDQKDKKKIKDSMMFG